MTIPERIPPFRTIDSIPLPETEIRLLSNGVNLHLIDSGDEDIVKLDLVFLSGRPFEQKPLLSRVTNALAKEGTRKYSGAEIHERFDYYGATLHSPVNLDTGNLTLFCLGKFFSDILPVFRDIILYPRFPETELELLTSRLKQQLKMDLTKGDILGYRKITESIFGESHPYGYNSSPGGYDEIKLKDCIDHHSRCYTGQNCFAFYCGQLKEDRITQIVELLEEIPEGESLIPFFPSTFPKPKKHHLEIDRAPQTSLKIGSRLFPRSHPDYPKMFVLNTILGGYFGSRLMTNIRETKGYTYNIYSHLDTMMFDGCFYISSDIKKGFEKETLREIEWEMNTLKTDKLSMEELTMVKNYLMGVFLSSVDGPLKSSEVIKTIYVEKLGLDAMDKLIHIIKEITPEDICNTAANYLHLESMHSVKVG